MMKRFGRCAAVLMCMLLSASACAETTRIPAGTTAIEAEAFEGDSAVKQLYLPDGLKSIGNGAFKNTGIVRLNLPDSLTSIAEDAFDGIGDPVTFVSSDVASNWRYARSHTKWQIWDTNPMPVGESAMSLISNEWLACRFIAPTAGEYAFFSEANEDTRATLHSADGSKLASDDDSGRGENFLICHSMDGGASVYLRASFYENAEQGNLPVVIAPVIRGGAHRAASLKRFVVIPALTGSYVLRSSGTADVSASLSSTTKLLAEDDNGEDGVNFRMESRLSKGKPYFLTVTGAAGDTVIHLDPLLSVGDNTVAAAGGETVAHFTADTNHLYRFTVPSGVECVITAADGSAPEVQSGTDEAGNTLYDVRLEDGQRILLTLKTDGETANVKVEAVTDDTVTYRYYMVGQLYKGMESELNAPEKDCRTIEKIIDRMSGTPYTGHIAVDVTAQGILNGISAAFADADENDVSLFFYSGHGANGGMLVGTDMYGVSPSRLRSTLDKVPGKKIIIVDACYSGGLINKTDGAESADNFSSAFISAFRSGSGAKTAGYLDEPNYFVLTATSRDELSYEGQLNDSYSGLYTYFLGMGCGYNAFSQQFTGKEPADADKNGVFTMNELASYAESGILDHFSGSEQVQLPRCYPENSTQVIFAH